MEFIVRDLHDQRLIEGAAGRNIMERTDDVNRAIEVCFEHDVSRLLLYPENLTAHFFDLSSGEAGAILQKLRTYHIRVAIVRTPDLHMSSRFGELLADEQRGPYFRLFDDRAAAEAWLCAE